VKISGLYCGSISWDYPKNYVCPTRENNYQKSVIAIFGEVDPLSVVTTLVPESHFRKLPFRPSFSTKHILYILYYKSLCGQRNNKNHKWHWRILSKIVEIFDHQKKYFLNGELHIIVKLKEFINPDPLESSYVR